MQISTSDALSSSLTMHDTETVDPSSSPLKEKKIMLIPPMNQWGLSDYLSYYAKPASIATDCISCISLATLLIAPLGKIYLFSFAIFASSSIVRNYFQQKHM